MSILIRDFFPLLKAQVQAGRYSALPWEFTDWAKWIKTAALRAAWNTKDAVKGQEIVCRS